MAITSSHSLAVALLLAAPTTAQVDINAILQASNAGVQMVPDTDPFSPNTFIGSFRMEMHLYKNGSEEQHSPMDMLMHSSAEKTCMETRTPGVKEQVRMLIDQKEKWQYMLMDEGTGNRMAMKTRKMKVVSTTDEQVSAPDVQVTDETKTIDGHLCKKLISKSEDGTWTGWMAQDIDVPFHSFMRDMHQNGQHMYSGAIAGVHGFPLEYEWISSKGDERIQCYIKDLKLGVVDEKIFSLDGYQVVELPALPAMGR